MEWAICRKCRHPNIIWQVWRNKFRCGWCGQDYTTTDAAKLRQLSDQDYDKLMWRRRKVITQSRTLGKPALRPAGKKGKNEKGRIQETGLKNE